MKQLIFLLLLILIGHRAAHSQEVLAPLSQNPQKSKEALEKQQAEKRSSSAINLPFWDDFSYEGPYPDNRLWADNNVFINSHYPNQPKTIGAATFDALDAMGNLYEHATANNTPFPADYLTSKSIRLDKVFTPQPKTLTPADSVLLSFYYQPQGHGGSPAPQDSLVLQLYHPAHKNDNGTRVEAGWKSVWKATGETLSGFSKDTIPYFKRVVIPIIDEAYFTDEFRFRFINYVSYPPPFNKDIPNYTGTRSIWNIDYVYLDYNRQTTDKQYYDIAFAAPAQPLLREYTAMPWNHFIINPGDHLRDRFDIRIVNLDDRSYNYSYQYKIQDEARRTLRTYSGGSWVIAPFAEHGYQEYTPHSNPILIPNPLPVGPALERHFRIVHSIREGATGDNYPRNDTIAYKQHFSNFFAYDNGTPEMISMLIGYDPTRACEFFASTPDTLEAIQVYFMETVDARADQGFYLKVWSSLDSEENIIYRSEDAVFADQGEINDGFFTYYLKNPVPVENTFYIGFKHYGNIRFREAIPVGFDKHNNVQQRMYNRFDEHGWQLSTEEGGLMLRAVMKRASTTETRHPTDPASDLLIYPNPVKGSKLNLEITPPPENNRATTVYIFDTLGQQVYHGAYSSSINISSLSNGLYILRVIDQQGQKPVSARFIISR